MTKAADQAYDIIRRAILDGVFGPGDHLKEEQLVERCGVSRTPIREAIQRLSSENYLMTKPNSGSYVANWSVQEIADIFALRATIEGMACYRAARNITREQLAILQAQYDKVAAALEGPNATIDIDMFLEANRIFHRVILEATQSEPLMQAAQRIFSPPMVSRTAYNYTKEDIRRSNAHHLELIEGLKVGDGEWCEATMCSHIRAAHHRFLETLN